MTNLTYQEHSNLYSLKTNVVESGVDDVGQWVVLDSTVAHPKGGGQRADKCEIDGKPVINVLHAENGVRHYINTGNLEIGSTITITIDQAERLLNSRWHTAGHLVASIFNDELDNFVAARSHQYPGEGWVGGSYPLNVETINVQKINGTIRNAINLNLAITSNKNGSQSREITIAGFDPIRCGGTHVTSLSLLESCLVTRVKNRKGQLKISYSL